MKLIIENSSKEAGEFVALYIKKRINDFHPTEDRPFTLALPAGDEMLEMYKKLVELHKNGEVSFENVITFNTEEYIGLPRECKQTVHTFMLNNFFRYIDIKPKNANILNGNDENLTDECKKYEEKIKASGGIELLIATCGCDGSLAFNEPASSLNTLTRVKTLSLEAKQSLSKYFDNKLELVPNQALTVGVKTMMDSHEAVLLITGVHKSLVLHKAIEEGISHMCTLSTFQAHQQATFVIDDDATLELKVKTVKYFKGLMKHHQKMLEPASTQQ
uniref:Glucosamine-6-phosphate deaminase n=1 Tax=Syphacia muris TaxID=451379 RepID=A0A0N5ASM9_9BILA